MPRAPVEYIIVKFPGNQFDGTLVPALRDLTERGVVHIIDMVFVTKDADGEISFLEFDELPGGAAGLAELDGEAGDLLNEEDIQLVAAGIEPGSSVALLVWEDLWAIPVAEALRRCGAELVDGGRIPVGILETALAAAGN